MNKHVNKLSKEATDARKMIEDSGSESDDSDDDNKRNGNKIRFCFPKEIFILCIFP